MKLIKSTFSIEMAFENERKTAESSLCSLLLRKQNEKLELARKRPLKIPSTALTHSEKYVEDRMKRDTAWKNISTEKKKLLIVFLFYLMPFFIYFFIIHIKYPNEPQMLNLFGLIQEWVVLIQLQLIIHMLGYIAQSLIHMV